MQRVILHSRSTPWFCDAIRDDRFTMSTNTKQRQYRHRTSMTTASVNSVSPHAAQTTPEFIRLPKSGQRCLYTGMSRASLNELVLGVGAPVHSVVLRREGASRGIRLIHLESLLHYLHQQMEEQINAIQEGEENASQVCHSRAAAQPKPSRQ